MAFVNQYVIDLQTFSFNLSYYTKLLNSGITAKDQLGKKMKVIY